MKAPASAPLRGARITWGLPGLLLGFLSIADPAAAQVATGTYLGNGVNGRIVNIGFQPDVVIVKVNWGDATADNSATLIRTTTMPANNSKPMRGSQALIATGIRSFTATGFTVGTDNRVNSNTYCGGVCTYYWVAFKANANLKVSSYTGGGGSQSITGLGFSPDYAMVLPGNTYQCRHRPRAGGARSDIFGVSGARTDAITSLDGDGFAVNDTGENSSPNLATVTYHYVAWNAVAGQTSVGSYTGNDVDNRAIGLPGFQPQYVIVQSIEATGRRCYQRMASIPAGDNSISFDTTPGATGNPGLETNRIQALLPRGFEVGTYSSVNESAVPYFYVAFGKLPNYRSIGTAPDLTNQGTITVTAGSTSVTKAGGTGWKAANRGRGDRLTVGTDHYVIAGVSSDDALTLVSPAVAGYTGGTYTIARQFTTLQGWEDCVSRSGANTCKRPADTQEYFATATSSLVADDRSEVGIAYKDGVFYFGPSGSGPGLPNAPLRFDGSTTDAGHTITLTADPGNRHMGSPGGGVRIDGENTVNGIWIYDANVTVEWLEVSRVKGGGPSAGIVIGNDGTETNVLVQNVLVHDFFIAGTGSAAVNGAAIRLRGSAGKNVTIRNAMIWDGDDYAGIEADEIADSLTIENCSVDGIPSPGLAVDAMGTVGVVVKNTISIGACVGCAFGASQGGSFGAASTNNSSSDGTAPGANPLINVTAASVFVAPNSNLHLRIGAFPQIDSGIDLSTSFTSDVDGQVRPLGGGWDRGADERVTPSTYRSIGTAADLVNQGTITVTAGSTTATKTGGTGWLTANRGRGDRLTIGTNHYVIAAVSSDNALRLASPAVASYTGGTYSIARQFTTLQGWEDCVSRSGATPCKRPADTQEYFATASASLVADDRAEVGIAYADTTFTGALTIDGSTSDATHTITLTADGDNRHYGLPGQGVVINRGGAAGYVMQVLDDFVTVEWMELTNNIASPADGIFVNNLTAGTGSLVVLRNNLIHNVAGCGAGLSDADGRVDVYNNIMYGNLCGVHVNPGSLLAGSRFRILNNTFYGHTNEGAAKTPGASAAATILLRNNIAVGNGFNEYDCDPLDSLDPASSHNLSEDVTGATNSPAGGSVTSTIANVRFVNAAGGNFHIAATSTALDAGASLVDVFSTDVDGQPRPAGAAWDMGADEMAPKVAATPVGSACAVGVPTGPNLVVHGTFDAGTADGANGFTHLNIGWSLPGGGVNCPVDTNEGISTNQHACGGINDWLSQFPGDPVFGVAGAGNSLYANGNGNVGPTVIWRQTVTGLSVGTTYTFYLYASNGNNGVVVQPGILPVLQFCKGVTGGPPYGCATTLLAATSVPNETAATGDVWQRYQATFTAGAGDTSVDLAVLDAAAGTNGDDIQITQIGLQACGPATAVELMSFSAAAAPSAVQLAWQTGSEVDNLGFHLYRSSLSSGPWTRLTSALIPGRGFSATGAGYSWRDAGLVNGERYYYRLEDVDTRSGSTFHGPVSAVPLAETAPPEGGGSGSGAGSGGVPPSSTCPSWALAQLGSSTSYACETHLEPASSFRVLSRTSRSVLVELETKGFLTARDATGRVRVLVPGFDSLADPLAPALPLKRARLAGLVGRQGRIGAIQARENRFFPGLHAAAVGYPEALVARDGTVNAGRREAEMTLSRGVFPRVQARLAGEGFQGEDKTLALELLPVRYDASRGAIVLSRRLTVRIDFAGALPSETGRGRLGRRVPRSQPDSYAYAFLGTSQEGLHAVAFEAVFPGRSRPVDLSVLRLTRRAVPVPFFVLPQGSTFGPGSRLFFHVDATASSVSFSPEVVYALERGAEGPSMSLVSAAPDNSPAVASSGFASFETNRVFAPDVLDIEDPWQWESIGSGVSKTKPFALDGLDASSSETARLVVHLQGGSDAVSVVDHHVQVFVKGALGPVLVADETFDGAVPHRVEADVPVSLLAAGNELTVTNVGDTGVSSRVFLDRFEIVYPQVTAARSGVFDGVFSSAGTAEVVGLAPVALLDVTSGASWLTGFEPGPTLRFRAEAGHRYLAVSQEGPSRPPRLLPRALGPPAIETEPGRLRARRAEGLPRRGAAAPRAARGPGTHHLCRLPRGDRLLLRRRPALGRGHPRLPLLRLPPVATALAPLRPPPRRLEPRPEALQPRLAALADALPPPEDLLHLDRLGPRSRRRQRRRCAARPRDRTAPCHHTRAGRDDGRQDPRLGGPGPEPRRQGRPRGRQPRPGRRLRGRRPRHRGIVPDRKGNNEDLPGPAAQPRRGPQPDPRRLQRRPVARSPTSATAAAASGRARTCSTSPIPPRFSPSLASPSCSR